MGWNEPERNRLRDVSNLHLEEPRQIAAIHSPGGVRWVLALNDSLEQKNLALPQPDIMQQPRHLGMYEYRN